MASKGSVISTIVLSFFVLAIVTVIHGKPSKSTEAKEVATQITAPVTVEMVKQSGVATQEPTFEVEQRDDNNEHHHEVVQRCGEDRCCCCGDCQAILCLVYLSSITSCSCKTCCD